MTASPLWDECYKTGYGTYCPSEDVAMFLSRLSPGVLLDIGCGTGANLLYAASSGWVVHGVDSSREAVKTAAARLAYYLAMIILDDITACSYESGLFDAVIDVECLYCLPEKEAQAMYDEIYRILKPGGKFFTKRFASHSSREKEIMPNAYYPSQKEMFKMLHSFQIEDFYLLERQYQSGSISEYVITAVK